MLSGHIALEEISPETKKTLLIWQKNAQIGKWACLFILIQLNFYMLNKMFLWDKSIYQSKELLFLKGYASLIWPDASVCLRASSTFGKGCFFLSWVCDFFLNIIWPIFSTIVELCLCLSLWKMSDYANEQFMYTESYMY